MADMMLEAWRYAKERFGSKGVIMCRHKAADGSDAIEPYWIGQESNEIFYCLGSGKTWRKAIESAKGADSYRFQIPLT
jgi:hypothetical protein